MLDVPRIRLTPARLALIYVAASGLWVLASSELVFSALKTPEAITQWEVIKGIAFIAASGALIYWVTRRLLDRLLESEDSLQKVEAKAQRLQNQLIGAQKLEALGRLAGGITHDFNNFLNIIACNAHVLQREISSPSGQSRLDAIMGATQAAAALTRQLLTFSRRQMLDPKPVNLNTIVQQTSGLLQRPLGAEMKLCLRLDPDLWNVIADPDQMAQVVMNLCVNASDAMPHGGTLEIETKNLMVGEDLVARLAESVPGPNVLLTVRDDGFGISPAVQEKMFEPFFTTKDPGKGTGLGLSIVYGIVKQAGGFIDVTSEFGKGTSFHIYIPARP